MALATKCPHCNTTFRVAADQLKLRGGIVRCGSCNELFDGNATLVDAAISVAALKDPEAELAATLPAAHAELDFDTSFDPFGILPGPVHSGPASEPEAESGPPPAPSPEPAFTPPATAPAPGAEAETIVAAPVRDDGHFLPVRRSRPPPVAAAVPFVADVVEPEFVILGRRRQRSGKHATLLMGAASLLLLLALLVQGVIALRNPLAAQMPALKPALLALCAGLGCRVELPAQIEYVTIDQGELQTLSEVTFSYATLLHNQGSSVQAWPDIELILNDGADQALLRRVFTPSEYLGPPAAADTGLAPHSEQAVRLYFELAGVKASGYHIAVFYP